MDNRIDYKYDATCGVLIKISYLSVKIIKKNNLVWKKLGPEDEMYARAIYLGQGCWERLDNITEEKALDILAQWGYNQEKEE